MTIKELKELIEHYEKNNPAFLESEIVIVVKEDSFGPVACSRVKNCFSGFDWEQGKFLIYPKDDLIRK